VADREARRAGIPRTAAPTSATRPRAGTTTAPAVTVTPVATGSSGTVRGPAGSRSRARMATAPAVEAR
jgi:hypothetical protein